MAVNLDTSLNVGKIQQNNLQSVLNTLNTQADPSPILSSNSLTVTNAPANLEKLAAKLGLETNSTHENVTKATLSSAFDVIIAYAEKNIDKTEKNVAILDEAKSLKDQLADVESQITNKTAQIDQLTETQAKTQESVSTAQKNVKSAQENVNKFQQDVSTLTEARTNLNTEISLATNPAKKATLEAKRDVVDAQLAEATEQLSKAQNTLSSAQTNLTTAQTNLSNVNAQLTAAQNEKASLQEQKIDLGTQVKNKLDELQDTNVTKAASDALRGEIKADAEYDSVEQDRSEEEEKYLDKHSPLRIMQDAILNHDSEILDTINSKREEKI